MLSWATASALFAWLIGAACVAFAWRKRQSIERLAPPETARLLDELCVEAAGSAELDPTARRAAIAELNQRLGDIAFALDVLPATEVALIRISLASGSALALASFMISVEEPVLVRSLRLGIAAMGGLSGAAGVGFIGRAAKTRAREIRQEWDRSSRDIGKALGVSLENPKG